MKKHSMLKKASKKSAIQKSSSKKTVLKKAAVKKIKERYVVLSLSMVRIDDRDVPIFQLKDVKEDALIIKTALDIICAPEIAFALNKPDLLQVSYFAGNMMAS